jgi:hypothetical protein
MAWSFSGHHIFIQCQRKWFFMQKMASPLANDPKRREAHILGQLKSIPAWRGSIVDQVIEDAVVPSIQNRNMPSQDTVLAYAQKLTNEQLQFASAKRYREKGMTKQKAGRSYAALFALEYGTEIASEELLTAKMEIETSLRNLMSSKEMLDTLLQARWLRAQCSLSFKLDGSDISVRAHPDLVAFYDGEKPLVVDWKVSTNQASDYWLQLAVYALALSRSDWIGRIVTNKINPTEIRLVEANLLNNNFKDHALDDHDLAELEDLIADSAWQMQLLDSGQKYTESEVLEYGTARNPRSCEYCQYKRLCW